MALMLHVVYKGHVLPLAWRVRHGKQGYCSADLHIALIETVQERIPPGTLVVLLGNGTCNGLRLPHTVHNAGWCYVAPGAI